MLDFSICLRLPDSLLDDHPLGHLGVVAIIALYTNRKIGIIFSSLLFTLKDYEVCIKR